MSSSMFKCKHCGVAMTGSESYQQHLAGRKHLKALKAASTSVSDSVTSSTSEPDVGYSEQLVTPSIGTDKHRKQRDLIPPTEQDILGTGNTDPVMSAVKVNLLVTRVAYERKCDFCNLDYTSKRHEDEHLSGKKHKQKVRMLEASQGINSATFYCGFCNIQVNSIEQMDQHRSGVAHNMAVSARRTEQEKPGTKSSETETPDTTQGIQAATLYCGFCNLQVNSIEQMDQHISGKAHNKKVAKARQTWEDMPHSAAKKKFVPSSGTETFDSASSGTDTFDSLNCGTETFDSLSSGTETFDSNELMPPPVPPNDLLQI